MSKNKDPLKEILKKRYEEVSHSQEDVKVDNSAVSTIIYVPHLIDKKRYIVKLEYSLSFESDNLMNKQCLARVLGIQDLDQKIIGMLYEQDQINLKFYYEKAQKREKK